jgi:hypothetical protein
MVITIIALIVGALCWPAALAMFYLGHYGLCMFCILMSLSNLWLFTHCLARKRHL